MDNFDIVWSFPFDSLHTAELGVTKHIWELMLPILKKAQRDTSNGFLKNTRPPHHVGTLPKEISEMNTYKAKDWRIFLLAYSIPVFMYILPDDLMHHYVLLVKSSYILYQKEISPFELQECDKMLTEFVGIYQILHGENSMRFNVHLLLHAVDSVRNTGPLWENSTYPFEGNIHFF